MELAIKKDGVIYLKTRIPKRLKHECDECDYGGKYGRKNNCDNYTLDGCKANFHYKIKKDNNMKKSELSFKCYIKDAETELSLRKALCDAGFEDDLKCPRNHLFNIPFIVFKNSCIGGASAAAFCAYDAPLMTAADALKLIESIEPDAPEFDIKPFDRVLIKDMENQWSADLFNKLCDDEFDLVACQSTKMIKYEGNERFHGTTDMPNGWWECENGKPVWRTK